MAITPGNSSTILHIRPESNSSADVWAARLQSTGATVNVRHDIYRALVHWSHLRETPRPVLVICVDMLDFNEMEFFHLSKKLCPDGLQFVYGVNSARLEEAVRVGAVSVVGIDPSDLAEMIGLCSTDAEESVESFTDPDDPTARDRADQTPVDSKTFETLEPEDVGGSPDDTPFRVVSSDDADPEHDDDSDDTLSSPARVPWLRYPSSVVRTGPAQQSPMTPLHSESSSLDKPPVRESLLTPEELAALIDDEPPVAVRSQERRKGGE